MIFVLLKNKLH